MDAERWARIEQLCQEALERSEEQQAAFLESACGADQELRRGVESLLAHRRHAESFIEVPAMHMAARALAAEHNNGTTETSRQIGRLISNYRIVEKVASGGMGDVYRAVRADGTYDKEVAIKLLQGARSSDFFLARFQNERQILADLDHPNIARLLDGGTTEEGLPYLVMEYIRGLPIDDFCAQKKLDTRERLALFRNVCSAVQYAHQNLVIHRDLKPSNILVTPEGVPKLLDFGIAKILSPQPGEENLQQTVTMLRLMTPDYASPEQVRNGPISTASDVYSLGVILYVLLTGRSPYRVNTGSPQEMMQAICNTEPERPSTAAMLGRASAGPDQLQPFSSGPAPQQEEAKRQKLRKVLAGDLDNIVLKALRKEPQRRYSSIEQFSEDIRHYLIGLPVLAHKDTFGYRAGKFIRRHKLGVAAVTLLVLSLAGGLLATLWQARIARAERARAERRFNDVRKLANSLIFEVHDSIKALPGATAARKVIVQQAQEYLDSLASESASDPSLLRELAAAYTRLANVLGDPRDANLGNSEQAMKDYSRAIELREAIAAISPSPDSQRELAESYLPLADLLRDSGQLQAGLAYIDKAIAILQTLAAANPGDQKIQSALAKALEAKAGNLAVSAKWPEVLTNYQKALEIYEHLLQLDPKNALYLTNVCFAHKHVGAVLGMQKQLQAALDHYQVALAIDEARIKADPENANIRYAITFTYNDIGYYLGEQGKIDEALDSYRKSVAIRSQLVAADPNDTRARGGLANNYSNMAWLLLKRHDFEAALENYKQALSLRQKLSQQDPTNELKQAQKAVAQAGVGYTYFQMAFYGQTGLQRRAALCREGRFRAQQALPGLQQHKKQLHGEEANFIDLLQQSLGRCQELRAPGQTADGAPAKPR